MRLSQIAGLVMVIFILCTSSSQASGAENTAPILSASHTIEHLTREGLSKLYRVGTRFYSGARPKGEEAFQSLKEMGITTLINVDDATPDYEAASRYGLTYFHFPVSRKRVFPKPIQAAAEVVSGTTGPVYIHCKTGTNPGPATIAILLRKMEGWSEEEAIGWLELARTSHQNEGLYDAVREYEKLFAKPVPPSERLVGIAYTTWHHRLPWQGVWGEPELGFYKSDDRAVIRQHAEWLVDAGVDFIWIDWSNNVNYIPGETPDPVFDMIEGSVKVLFEEYARLPRHPKISIFAGVTGAPEAATDGRLQKKADQIYRDYVANPVYRPLLQDYQGKPLLVVYVNTPSPWQEGVPKWDDDRFTVRWMTGYVTEQSNLRTPGLVSKYGYWSWEDRGLQTYPIHDGKPEAMVVTASWRRQSEPDQPGYIPEAPRDGGKTFRNQWARACEIGPKFAMVVSWNEWVLGEQPSPEVSKDIEPSKIHGRFYLDLLKEEIARFKGGQ